MHLVVPDLRSGNIHLLCRLSELRRCYGWMSLGDLELVAAVDPVHRYCPCRGWLGRCKLFGLAKDAAVLGLSQRS